MKEFATDIDAARHFVSMGILEDRPGSTHKLILRITPGDPYVGNRGVGSVLGIGEALAQLRNEAGLTPGQVVISRGPEGVTIETTMDNWNVLKAHVQGVQPNARERTR
jgi:hypothetical protein